MARHHGGHVSVPEMFADIAACSAAWLSVTDEFGVPSWHAIMLNRLGQPCTARVRLDM